MLNVQAEPIGIAIIIGIVVVGNAALSLVLERQGFGPGPALRQFVVTGLLNIVVVIVMFFVFDLLGYPIDGQNTGFFVFLITLLVTLYDRYRPEYVARFSKTRRKPRPPAERDRRCRMIGPDTEASAGPEPTDKPHRRRAASRPCCCPWRCASRRCAAPSASRSSTAAPAAASSLAVSPMPRSSRSSRPSSWSWPASSWLVDDPAVPAGGRSSSSTMPSRPSLASPTARSRGASDLAAVGGDHRRSSASSGVRAASTSI